MKRCAIVVAMISMVTVSVANADWDTPVTGVATVGRVKDIQIGGDGAFSFSLVGDSAICSGGTYPRRGAVLPGATVNGVLITQEGARLLHSTLVSSLLSGRQVRVYAVNNSSGGWGCRVGALDLL